jgi:hypothetical protein
MESTFFLFGMFPPPSSRPDVIAGQDSSGTWLTTNTWKSFVVKRIVWYIVLHDKRFDFSFTPFNQWIDFDEVVY